MYHGVHSYSNEGGTFVRVLNQSVTSEPQPTCPSSSILGDLAEPSTSCLAAETAEAYSLVSQDQLETVNASCDQINAVESVSCRPSILVTPESIRPYPKVIRRKANNKGRQPGKSRIYTDSPETNKLEEKYKEKEQKKIEKERRAKAIVMKRALKDKNSKPKMKKAKKLEKYDSESEDSEIKAIDISAKNIKDNCFLLVKFERKTSVLHYVGKVISHYSGTEFKVSYLRKKPDRRGHSFFQMWQTNTLSTLMTLQRFYPIQRHHQLVQQEHQDSLRSQ